MLGIAIISHPVYRYVQKPRVKQRKFAKVIKMKTMALLYSSLEAHEKLCSCTCNTSHFKAHKHRDMNQQMYTYTHVVEALINLFTNLSNCFTVISFTKSTSEMTNNLLVTKNMLNQKKPQTHNSNHSLDFNALLIFNYESLAASHFSYLHKKQLPNIATYCSQYL